jgi:hypothetical protein
MKNILVFTKYITYCYWLWTTGRWGGGSRFVIIPGSIFSRSLFWAHTIAYFFDTQLSVLWQFLAFTQCTVAQGIIDWQIAANTHTHTHTHTYIYIYSVKARKCNLYSPKQSIQTLDTEAEGTIIRLQQSNKCKLKASSNKTDTGTKFKPKAEGLKIRAYRTAGALATSFCYCV